MWKRYRDWSRLAYLSTFERRLNRALWAVLAIALAYAVSQKVLLAHVPELFRGGARIGTLLYDLSIAYAGAFTFYLLVVRLPLRRDRQNVYRHIGWLIWLIIEHARNLMTTLNRAAQIEPADRPNTWANVSDLCAKIAPNSDAPMDQGVQLTPNNQVRPVTVLYVILDRIGRTQTCMDGILSYAASVPSELIDLLTAIERYSHFRSFRQIAQMAQQFPGLQFGVGNQDLTMWSKQIFDYLLLVDRLDAYAQEFGLGGVPERPPGLLDHDDPRSDEVPLVRLMNGTA